MIKLLHSADWHLDAPMTGFSPQQRQLLQQELDSIPQRIAGLCRAHGAQLLLLAGDLFDGAYRKQTLQQVQSVLGQLEIPVLISPGNHDPIGPDSPYTQPGWPDNVHIFTQPTITSIGFSQLSLRVWGAGYQAMDCPALLEGFTAQGSESWQIGLLHGQVDNPLSPYCPITRDQLRSSGLQYLALGHIHKADSLRCGECSCAWPGCPMGKGFDELEEKGVILVTLDQTVSASFLPLDVPRFFDLQAEAGVNPREAVTALLPAIGNRDFYRITLTGYSAGIDLIQLQQEFPQFPNLILKDQTLPEMELWSAVGEDSLEGVYFSLLKDATRRDNATVARRAAMAARISRQILDGQEVKLP